MSGILSDIGSYFTELTESGVFGNSILAWGSTALSALVLYVIAVSSRRLLIGRFRVLQERRPEDLFTKVILGILESTVRLVLLIFAVALVAPLLTLEPEANRFISLLVVLTAIFQASIWATRTLRIWLPAYLDKRVPEGTSASAVSLLEFLGITVIWGFAVLLMLDNIGVNITALIAGLGIGGVAVALAVQNILGDLLSSLSIVLDKPFEVGDFIITGEFLGVVERIGIKTTRLRSLSGEQVVISNSDLLKSRIRNYKRMYERRVVFTFRLPYHTPLAEVKEVPTIVREAIEKQENVRFDRAHFQAFGEFALVFEAVYYVLSPNYNVYMDTQQAINLYLCEAFAARDIKFAYPTRTLYMEASDTSTKEPARAPAE